MVSLLHKASNKYWLPCRIPYNRVWLFMSIIQIKTFFSFVKGKFYSYQLKSFDFVLSRKLSFIDAPYLQTFFNQTGIKLWTSSSLARNEFLNVRPILYSWYPAGNELVPRLTKNTAITIRKVLKTVFQKGKKYLWHILNPPPPQRVSLIIIMTIDNLTIAFLVR